MMSLPLSIPSQTDRSLRGPSFSPQFSQLCLSQVSPVTSLFLPSISRLVLLLSDLLKHSPQYPQGRYAAAELLPHAPVPSV